jgi:DNA-binding CsgD family transcriptional regulator
LTAKIDFTEFDRIVGDLYSAAAGRVDWSVPLNGFARVLTAQCVHFLAVSKANGALAFSHYGGPISPEALFDYIRSYHQDDPRTRIALAKAPGEWMHCHEHFDDAYVANSRFFQDFLIPYGSRYVSGTKLIEDDAQIVLLGFIRGPEQQPFDATELDYLNRIKTHFTRAVEIYQHLRTAYSELATGRELLNHFRYPMILVDEQRGIRFKNHMAKDFLASSECVVDRGGSLGCRTSEDETELTLALQALKLHPAAPKTEIEKAFVKMRRASDGRPIAVHVIAIRPQAVMSAFGATPLALLVFHDPHTQVALDPFIVAETFGLTPAEAKVAVGIANGKTPEAIALDFTVSVATVRSQLQSVFQKTGTNRQPDLVRVLTGMPDFGMTDYRTVRANITSL